MGAPVPEFEATENASAEALLSSLKTIAAKERRKHASVFNYWLSIRGNRPFPPIRDLDPLEISDAGPFSILLEMNGGGENADIRHFGHAIRGDLEVERISDAPTPSLLSCIHAKLPIVAACKQAFAFEEEFTTDEGTQRCWVTLLPFSATGTLIDFVYGFVSLEGDEEPAEEMAAAVDPNSEPFTVPLGPLDDESSEDSAEPAEYAEAAQGEPEEVEPLAELAEPEPETFEPVGEVEPVAEPLEEAMEPFELADEIEPVEEAAGDAGEAADQAYEPDPGAVEMTEYSEPLLETEPEKPGFSAKLREGLASLGGFYGQAVQLPPSSVVSEFPEQPEPEAQFQPAPEAAFEDNTGSSTRVTEGNLQTKLEELRAKAEEARQAKIRSNVALYEGLGAAYDFALDAENEPEEYLRLVEGQGLKIQLRSPMKPVVKLGFDGMCDDATIEQLEAVLAWALKLDLPRGTLAERIEAAGGIGPILNGQANA